MSASGVEIEYPQRFQHPFASNRRLASKSRHTIPKRSGSFELAKTCNINSREKLTRLAGGLLLIVVAVVLAVLTMLGIIGGLWAWVTAAVLLLFGLFGVYEGRTGWCAAKALGFKTWF